MSLDTHKRDFSINARLPGISALAAGIGALSTFAAFLLLGLVKPSLEHFDEEHKKERFQRLRVHTGRRHFPPVR